MEGSLAEGRELAHSGRAVGPVGRGTEVAPLRENRAKIKERGETGMPRAPRPADTWRFGPADTRRLPRGKVSAPDGCLVDGAAHVREKK